MLCLRSRIVVLRPSLDVEPVVDWLENRLDFGEELLVKWFGRGVAQLASSWVRSTRNFSTDVDPDRAFHSTERPLKVSGACGPRLEASRATRRYHSLSFRDRATLRGLIPAVVSNKRSCGNDSIQQLVPHAAAIFRRRCRSAFGRLLECGLLECRLGLRGPFR